MLGNALRGFLVLGLLLLLAHLVLIRLVTGDPGKTASSDFPGSHGPTQPTHQPHPPVFPGTTVPALALAPAPATAFTVATRDPGTSGMIVAAPTTPKTVCEDNADFERRILESPDVESFFRSRIVVDCAQPGAGANYHAIGQAGPAILSGRGDGAGPARTASAFLPGIFDGGGECGFTPY